MPTKKLFGLIFMNLHVFGLPEIVKIGFRFQRHLWLETTSLINYEILSFPLRHSGTGSGSSTGSSRN
ncbi:MAG: hypothetical protein ACLFT8_09145, partial [Desulfovermiculus sp.]